MGVLKVLECGWNLFGSCVVLAAYFSSVRSDSIEFGNAYVWGTVYVGVGCGIIAFVHVVWMNIPSSVRDLEWLTCMWSTWHGCSVAILEISYFLVLCQPLTANRASPSHIPSEHAYTPLLFAACFVAPRLLPSHGSCCDSCDERGMRSWMWDKPWILTSLLVVAINAICFFVVVASDRCHQDLSRKLDTSWTLGIFCLITLIYATPLPLLDNKQRGLAEKKQHGSIETTEIVALGVGKALVLSIGIILFQIKISSGSISTSSSAHTHDFYHLRIMTNDNSSVILGIAIKMSAVFSLCLLASHAASVIRLSLSNTTWGMGRTLAYLHELRVGILLLCIVLASFSVEASHEDFGANVKKIRDRHSTGIILSQGVLLVVMGLAWALASIRAN